MRNEAGHNEYTYEIVVYSPPFFKNATENQTKIIKAIAGTSIHVDCDADGLPTPNVRIKHIRRALFLHLSLPNFSIDFLDELDSQR